MQEQHRIFPTPPQSEHLEPPPNEALIKAESQLAHAHRLIIDARLLIDQAERVITESKVWLKRLRMKARLPQ